MTLNNEPVVVVIDIAQKLELTGIWHSTVSTESEEAVPDTERPKEMRNKSCQYHKLPPSRDHLENHLTTITLNRMEYR